MALGFVDKAPQQIAVHDRAARVARRAQIQQLQALPLALGQRLRVGQKTALGGRVEQRDARPGEPRRALVDRIKRVGHAHQRLAAAVDSGLGNGEQRLAGAVYR